MKLKYFAIAAVLIPLLAFGNGETVSPNMNLIVPSVGITTGPQWAADLNVSLGLIDAHDHSPGKGAPITPSGLNINADLSSHANNITNNRSIRFQPYANSGAFNATGADIGALYEINPELFFVDGAGNTVQITKNGFVNSGAGSISGLSGFPNASASYVGATGTFVWQQNISTAANMDMATLILRYPGSYPTPAGNFIAIQAPASLASGFAYTLPNNTPASSGAFLTSSTTGQISYTNTDNSTLNISGSTIRVAPLGITASQIANQTITATQIANQTITATQIANQTITATQIANNTITAAQTASNAIITGGTGVFSTASTTPVIPGGASFVITTNGGAVQINVQPDGSGAAYIRSWDGSSSPGVSGGSFYFFRDGVQKAQNLVDGGNIQYPSSCLNFVDTEVIGVPGTYLYRLEVASASGFTTTIANSKVVGHEIK